VLAADDGHTGDVGVAWAIEQTRELLERGAPSVHFYVMQNSRVVNRVLAGLGT